MLLQYDPDLPASCQQQAITGNWCPRHDNAQVMAHQHIAVVLLQSLEGLDPKTKLTGASQVTLSEAEVRSLRRDMQEQENIIQGYQVDNPFLLHALCTLDTTKRSESAPLSAYYSQFSSTLMLAQ